MADQTQTDVTAVDTPPARAAGPNKHYAGNRPPLRPSPLIKLPTGSIAPRGWLRGQLELMRDGMVGRLPELSKWCTYDDSAWVHADGQGENGWEEMPYWLRGYTSLAYVLRDERMIAEARRWIDGILRSQREDGWIGPRKNLTAAEEGVPAWESVGHTAESRDAPDIWPNMLVVNILQTHYEATRDERVLPCLANYFRWQLNLPESQFLPASWQQWRAGDDLASVLWLYNRTGEDWLLELADKVHQHAARWDREIPTWHGVNICQGFREPAVYYQRSGRRSDLDATERNYQHVMTVYGQVPGGMFAADENCRPGYFGPRQAAETCSMVEFMRSFEMLLGITGDVKYADRCEDVALNSLPAAMTPDLKALHYLTAPNMVQLDRRNKAPALENGGCMLAYTPHRYRCCQHNVSIGWPYYAEHLWMATRDNGLAAVLYAASDVTATVADGVEVTLHEGTGYPFSEDVALTINTPQEVAFPLYLRIPGWCEAPMVEVNGNPLEVGAGPEQYVRLERKWRDGDEVRLTLPMRIEVHTWETDADSVSVGRGPLTYSLKIGERWERFGDSEQWPGYEVFPTTPWNYGLIIDPDDPASSFELKRQAGEVLAQPFTPENAPIELTARGKRIPQWKQDAFGLVGRLQGSPAGSDEPVETIALIPLGCARLRISVFPTIGDGPEAIEWKAPAPLMEETLYYAAEATAGGRTSSEPSPSVGAAGPRGLKPAARFRPRFTWWPKRSTKEWVTYRFDQPRRVSWCEVRWFDDGPDGSYRAPESWRLYYLGEGFWREVPRGEGFSVKAGAFNRATFLPVQAEALKIEVQLQDGFSGGIMEWRVGDE